MRDYCLYFIKFEDMEQPWSRGYLEHLPSKHEVMGPSSDKGHW